MFFACIVADKHLSILLMRKKRGLLCVLSVSARSDAYKSLLPPAICDEKTFLWRPRTNKMTCCFAFYGGIDVVKVSEEFGGHPLATFK
jgi:hypothetical protein